ncbi:MAG: hypothetical protein V4667_04465 [Bacteroidota bacterium]
MPPEKNFEEYYRSVIPRFFKRELREIQEETNLLLTFKNYYAMKKVMLLSGAFSAFAFIAGSIFKIMHWPGASFMLVIGITIISFIFLPLLFLLKTKESKSVKDKIILGLGTFIGILFCLSALFKVMHWPGANLMMTVNLSTLFFLFLPIYFFGGIRNPENKVNTIVTSILILVAGGLLFMLVNLRPSRQMNFITYTAIKQVEESYNFATQQNQKMFELLSNDSTKNKSTVAELKTLCDEACFAIDSIKTNLLKRLAPDTTYTEEELYLTYGQNYDFATRFLFTDDAKAKSHLLNLKTKITALQNVLKQKHGFTNSILLNTDYVPKDNSEEMQLAWEQNNFYKVPLEFVMRNLTQIQLDIRLAESYCLK